MPEPTAAASAAGSVARGRRDALALCGLLAAYLGLALAYQRAVPLFEAPDEPSHIHYVVFLSREGRLPRMLERPEVPGEGMQPPLYYLLLAPLFAAIDRQDPGLPGTLHQTSLWTYKLDSSYESPPAGTRIRLLWTDGERRYYEVDPSLGYLRPLRLGSLACGLLAVLCTFAAARRVSGSTAFAILCTALLALSPQFLFVSSYVNNDAACAALGGAAFWLFAGALQRGRVTRGGYAGAGLLIALGLATKHSAVPALGVTFLALFAIDPRPLRTRLPDAGLAALLALALALPTWLSNVDRFGDPLGVGAVIASAEGLSTHEIYGSLLRYMLVDYWVMLFRSYWAYFGWMNILASKRVYRVFLALSVCGGLGFLWGWWRERRTAAAVWSDAATRARLRRSLALRRYLLATLLAILAPHLWLNLQTVAPQGRHLFGAAPQIAALLTLGITRLVGGRAFEVGPATAGAGAAGMAALAFYALLRVILPVYR